MIDKGCFVIVPLLSDDRSEAEIRAWHLMQPKEYRIRVCDPNYPDMRKKIPETSHE